MVYTLGIPLGLGPGKVRTLLVELTWLICPSDISVFGITYPGRDGLTPLGIDLSMDIS